MQAAFHPEAFASLDSGTVKIIDQAYELAVFQICDDGGLYSPLMPEEVKRLLRSAIVAEVICTGADDPERLKAVALAAVPISPARAWDAIAAIISSPPEEQSPCS